MEQLVWAGEFSIGFYYDVILIFSDLCSMVKTYTGSKGVQVTTIGVSPFCTTDAGHHTAEVRADANVYKAAPVSGLLLTKLWF